MTKDDRSIQVQCRKCDACVAARKRHWIGRLNAEAEVAQQVWFSTFTYAGGYENDEAYILNYKHLQDTFKRMRKAGHKFKYLAVGEYGGQGSRAHFHVMFFWLSTPPNLPMGQQIPSGEDPFWEKGLTQHEFPRSKQAAACYIMDYLDKDNMLNCELKYSKNPALGQDYLLEYARRHARDGLALFPRDAIFTIPDNKTRAGKLFYYPVGRQTALYEKMLSAYVNEWALVRPSQRLTLSEDVSEYLTDICQDPDQQTPAVQEYLARVYGYEASELPESSFKTIVLGDGICIRVINEDRAIAYLPDNKGNETWSSAFALDLTAVDATVSVVVQDNKVLRQALLEVNRLRHNDPYLKQLLQQRHSTQIQSAQNGENPYLLEMSAQARSTLKPLSTKEPPRPKEERFSLDRYYETGKMTALPPSLYKP